jgi:hypothetical protein
MHLLQIDNRTLHRRSAVRYKLQLPVIFNWNDGIEHTAAGFTSDVAIDGALIQSSVCPPTGSAVHFEVLTPAPDLSRDHLRIRCSGCVTRTDKQSGGYSFGVRGLFDDEHITRQFAM